MQHTMHYTPQHNGVAKHRNQTLKEMANCIFQSNNLARVMFFFGYDKDLKSY
jgi:hypothetical protein